MLDRGRQNGFTVMLDDIFAAVYASWLLIRWPGWQGSTEPLHYVDFAMNKEIEDKVKELSRRIVGTGQIVVTAESLTGGMISAALTSIPGASEWFERGFVTYTNQAKHEMLDVPQSILDRFSAVSTQTVSQMLEGAIRHSNATMAVAVSGIAGPDGAMPGKTGWNRLYRLEAQRRNG